MRKRALSVAYDSFFLFFFFNALVVLPTAGVLTAHESLYELAAGLPPRTAFAGNRDPALSFSLGQALPSPVGSGGREDACLC